MLDSWLGKSAPDVSRYRLVVSKHAFEVSAAMDAFPEHYRYRQIPATLIAPIMILSEDVQALHYRKHYQDLRLMHSLTFQGMSRHI